jgi:hypothetical protein
MLPLRDALFGDPLTADEAEAGWLLVRVPSSDGRRNRDDRPGGENDPERSHADACTGSTIATFMDPG